MESDCRLKDGKMDMQILTAEKWRRVWLWRRKTTMQKKSIWREKSGQWVCSRCYNVSLYSGVMLSEPVKELFIASVGGIFSRDIDAGSVARSLKLKKWNEKKWPHKLVWQIAVRKCFVPALTHFLAVKSVTLNFTFSHQSAAKKLVYYRPLSNASGSGKSYTLKHKIFVGCGVSCFLNRVFSQLDLVFQKEAFGFNCFLSNPQASAALWNSLCTMNVKKQRAVFTSFKWYFWYCCNTVKKKKRSSFISSKLWHFFPPDIAEQFQKWVKYDQHFAIYSTFFA